MSSAAGGGVDSSTKTIQPSINDNSGGSGATSLGFILMLGAFFCFATMDTSAKWLVTAAIPALQVAFLRYFFHFVWVMVLYAPNEKTELLVSNRPRLQILRALLLLSSTSLNFTALVYLPLTVTIAIFFAVPMVVCLLSIPVLGEKVGIKRFAAIIVGFVGVLIIVKPWGETFDYHVLLALGALLTAAGYFVMTRLIAGLDTNSVTQFYTSGIATLVLAPFALYYWVWPAVLLEWCIPILLGSLGMLGHTMVTRAHHYAEASVLAPMVYSQMIYITFYSWIIFNTKPDITTMIGTAIIIISGLYIWVRERKIQNPDTPIPLRGGR